MEQIEFLILCRGDVLLAELTLHESCLEFQNQIINVNILLRRPQDWNDSAPRKDNILLKQLWRLVYSAFIRKTHFWVRPKDLICWSFKARWQSPNQILKAFNELIKYDMTFNETSAAIASSTTQVREIMAHLLWHTITLFYSELALKPMYHLWWSLDIAA